MSLRVGLVKQKTCKYAKPTDVKDWVFCTRVPPELEHSVIDCAKCIYYQVPDDKQQQRKTKIR